MVSLTPTELEEVIWKGKKKKEQPVVELGVTTAYDKLIQEQQLETLVVPIIGKILPLRYGDTVEIAGAFGSGKTNLCHTIAGWFVKNTNRNVLYIDTERTFMAQRLKQICGDEELLKRIYTIELITATDLVTFILYSLESVVQEYNVGLLVIDSMINPFRAEFIGVKELAERQQILNKCLNTIRKIAKDNDVLVILTNQMVATPGSYTQNQPSGGNIMGHFAKYRFLIVKESDKRKLRVIDAPCLGKLEVRFKITDKGCVLVTERKKKN